MSANIGRVEKEYIFKFLQQNKINFEIKCKAGSTFSNLIDYSSTELKIDCVNMLNEMLEKNAEVEVFFYFQNNYHTFKAKVLKTKNNIAIIENPKSMIKNLQRKFNRVRMDGSMNLKFSIKGDLIKLSYPETEVNYFPGKPPINADFYDVNIGNIMKKFEDKMTELVSIHQIRMLRNYKPVTFEELMTIKYGRFLYVPDTRADVPQSQLIPEFNIILKADWIKYEILKNKSQPFMINKIVSSRLRFLSDNDIISHAIAPVLYRNYVVALIYLSNTMNKNVPISVKILNYTYNFCRLLSYMLKENGYFKEEEGNIQRYSVPVFDISPGGLSFSHNNNFFEDKLLINNNFQFIIDIKDQNVRINAKLVRKFKELTKYYYGFMFIDIKRSDFDFLNDYLYGSKQ